MLPAKEFRKNIYFCFIDYTKAFDCVDHNKLWKILKEMGIPDHLPCLLRPFRYDLNQILYDYTVEVRNRFKGLDLIGRVPDELWTEVHDIVQETGIKTIPKKKKCKKAKWLSSEALQITEKKRSEKQRRKEKMQASECRVPKKSKER